MKWGVREKDRPFARIKVPEGKRKWQDRWTRIILEAWVGAASLVVDGLVVIGDREGDVGVGMGGVEARRIEFMGKERVNMGRNWEIEIGREGEFGFNEVQKRGDGMRVSSLSLLSPLFIGFFSYYY